MTEQNENEGRWEPFVGKSIVGKTTEPTDTNIYWLEKFLGRGSFGGVFLADQTQRMATVGGKRIEINKKIAIKLMAASDAAIHEVSSALTIPEHIHLVRYFDANDVVIDEERLYVLTMELADGGSLRDLLGQRVLSEAETRAIAMNIAEGLSHLHSIVKTGYEDERWMHRDLKPENVLKVGKIWKIADFGTAKLLKKGTALASRLAGTYEYMPPEYFRDTYVSTKWDVWSFGVMIVEMLTGHRPFKGKTDGELSDKIQREHPDLNGVPTEWMEVIKGCLQKEYTRRWTADELLSALNNIAFSGSKSSTGSVSSTKVKSGGTKAASVTSSRSNNAWWIVGIFLVLGGGGFYLWQNFKPSSPLAPIASPSSPVLDKNKEAEALVTRAIEKSVNKDYKGAIADYTEAIRLKPNYAYAYLLKASVHSILKDSQSAISDLNKAIEISPKYAQAYSSRGLEKQNLGDKKGAIADYNQSIRLEPDSVTYFLRGNLQLSLDDKKAAIADYSESIKLNPKFPLTYFNRGVTKADIKDSQGAITDYDEAIRLKPDYFEAYYARSKSKTYLKDYEGAITDLNSVIRLKPDDAESYFKRGLLSYLLGDKQSAMNDFNESIRINPSSVILYANRGKLKDDLGDKQGAITDYDQAIKLQPDYDQVYISRGFMKYSLGDKQGAINDIRKASEIFKSKGNTENYNLAIKAIEQLQ